MEKISEKINNFNGELYDLCYELLEEEDIASVFEYVCKNFSGVTKSKEPAAQLYFSKAEIEQYKSVYGDIVDGLLNSTIKKCNYGLILPSDFYKYLWNSFCSNFTERKELAFAFYYTLIDRSIPYQFLGKPISMSNERFKELIEENEDSIDKVKYIVKSGYNQRTEEASLLLNCLDQIDDLESKAVVLACAINLFNSTRTSRSLNLSDLIEKIEELKQQSEQE